MRTRPARFTTFALLLSFTALPSCLCGVMSERPTSLAEWPAPRTLQVFVGSSGVAGAGAEDTVLHLGIAQPLDQPEECAVLGDDARWFAGDVGNDVFDHGHVEYNGTGGGDLTFGVFVKPFCISPSREVPIGEDGTDDNGRIAVGFADDSETWSVTMRKPPAAPTIELVDLEPRSVVARGQQVTLRSNTPLDGADTSVDVSFSQCQTGEDFTCALDPVFRLEGSELIVVTIPNNAASEGGTISIGVIETFRGEECTADACEADTELIWDASAEVVVQ